jgi:hypothetical protein
MLSKLGRRISRVQHLFQMSVFSRAMPHTELDYYPPDWAMHRGGWSAFAGQVSAAPARIIIRHHVFGLVQIRAKRPFSPFSPFFTELSRRAHL